MRSNSHLHSIGSRSRIYLHARIIWRTTASIKKGSPRTVIIGNGNRQWREVSGAPGHVLNAITVLIF